MRLLDRFEGRRGVVQLIVIGVIAAAVGTAVAIFAWGGQSDDDDQRAAAERTTGPGDTLVEVVSRPGGFSVQAPDALVGDEAGQGVKLTTQRGDVVITVAPTGASGLGPGHQSTLDAIRSTYAEMRVDQEVRTVMGGLDARRSVGTVRRDRGDQIIFSVTTAANDSRSWSVVMFAATDVDPARLERFYQPVLDGFRVLR